MREELVELTNNKIDNLIKYGYRTVTTRKRGYKLVWSNNMARWYPSGRVLPAGSYKIDANEIIVEAPSTEIEEMLPLFHPLPLYENSSEARSRGIFKGRMKEYYDEESENRKKKTAKPKSKRKSKKKDCGCK